MPVKIKLGLSLAVVLVAAIAAPEAFGATQ